MEIQWSGSQALPILFYTLPEPWKNYSIHKSCSYWLQNTETPLVERVVVLVKIHPLFVLEWCMNPPKKGTVVDEFVHCVNLRTNKPHYGYNYIWALITRSPAKVELLLHSLYPCLKRISWGRGGECLVTLYHNRLQSVCGKTRNVALLEIDTYIRSQSPEWGTVVASLISIKHGSRWQIHRPCPHCQ